MSITDAESTVITLLNDNWNAANTDQITPLIDSIKLYNTVGGMDNRGDLVLINETVTTPTIISIGALARMTRTQVTIDIRTSENRPNLTWRAHVLNMLKEVDRIMWANIVNPDANYHIEDPGQWMDLSDKRRNFGRYTYEVFMEKLVDTG